MENANAVFHPKGVRVVLVTYARPPYWKIKIEIWSFTFDDSGT